MSLEVDADDWFARMRGPDAEGAREDFESWYAVAEHAEAYDRRARLWDATKFLTNTDTGRARNLDLAKAAPHPRSRWIVVVALLGMLFAATLAVVTIWRQDVNQNDVVRTEVASLEEVPRHLSLPDGSSVILDRGARLQIAFRGGERRLRLLAGRARFSVAHDKFRPFIVEAGAGSVTAHGTLFDVDLTKGSINVSLLEGAVEVRSRSGGEGRKRVELSAGQRVSVAGGSLGQTTTVAAAERQWPNDMLLLDGTDIGDAVAAFNRTSSAPVVFDVRSGKPMKVTGAFRRSDPQLFAQQLAQTFGLSVENREDGSFALVDADKQKNLRCRRVGHPHGVSSLKDPAESGSRGRRFISALSTPGVLQHCCSRDDFLRAGFGQVGTRLEVHFPAQSLAKSLRDIGLLFGRNVIVEDAVVSGRTAGPLDGKMTFEEALQTLLAGMGLRAGRSGSGAIIQALSQADGENDSIVVTGTRIRGAPVASTTLTYDREAMRDAGQSTVADVIRSVPQNFGGGQNAGLGYNVPAASGADLDGGSSINLRGLGSDATLTLLNGRRMSYAGAAQAVDVSAIPFGAIERIDIVPDGASALFGSDAVAGVANIVLRQGFDGLEASARLGGSTDGGNFQQQYGATAGKVWQSGSATLSYEYARTTAIEADQRSYAEDRVPGLTLSPYMRHHNASLVLRQNLLDNLTFDLDALYNRRWWEQTIPLNAAGDLSVSRADFSRPSESWSAAPSLTLALPADWLVSLGGSYGWNRSKFGGEYVYGATKVDATSGVYRNTTGNIELSGNGKLITVPGGDIKAAVGAGYRKTTFQRTGSSASAFIDASQDSYYAFGELSVPVFGAGQASSLGRSLDLSLAARYERYPDVDSVVTPKFGVIYAPSEDVSIKGSWGRSFRTPTLYEQYRPATTLLYKAATLGGTAGGNAIYVSGGNPDLRPERSTNWSATLDLHPRAIEGAKLQVTYFDIRYRDRIVAPITYASKSLSNPDYADYVTLAPTADEQAAAIARGATFTNYTGAAYNPSTVVAIVDNSNVNAGRQSVHGVDVLASYEFGLAGGTLRTALNGSYLDSKQQLSAEQPVTQLAGTLFNPPHFRARGEVSWRQDGLSLMGAINYIGPVHDIRSTPSVRVAGMVPVDFTVHYSLDRAKGPLSGIDIIASIQNAFNYKPSSIAITSYFDTPYDSTNYSPFGRVLSLTVSKKW